MARAPHTSLSRRGYSSQSSAAQAMGIFNPRSAAIFVAAGTALYFYFQHEKRVAEEKREEALKRVQSIGKPKLGGPFTLTSASTRKPFTHEDLLGKFSIVYFGFTHCPDICPEEMEKIAEVVDAVDARIPGRVVTPVFITCDPRRDGIEEVAAYVQEFHPRMVGLTGTEEQVKDAARAYRVYYSTPPNVGPDEDYLVDHSIFAYLMDPKGKFVDCYGKDQVGAKVTESVLSHINDWRVAGNAIVQS